MNHSLFHFAAAILIAIVPHGFAFAGDSCYECHKTAGDKPSELFQHDIHRQKGVTCAGCHGGNSRSDDMEQAMNKNAGYHGVPKGDEISRACAACHGSPEKMKSFGSSLPTTQWENLQSSVHGKLTLTGNEHIVQCTTCHNAHGIVPVKNPSSPVYPTNVVATCTRCHSNTALMRSYNPSLPVDQLQKYRTSVHGMRNAKGDIKTAECASCHGSHDIRSSKDVKSKVYAANLPSTCATCHSNAEYMKSYNIPTDQYEKYSKSVHGVALLQKHDQGAPACNSCHGNHGAIPPGVESVSKVCGSCHALNAELFSTSPHKKAYDERRLPECETCHGSHEIIAASNKLLGVTPEAVCSRCHSERLNVNGYLAARTMRGLIDTLESEEQNALKLVDEAEQKGMEIGEAKFKLRDVRQARLQARTVIHAFNLGQFQTTITQGRITSLTVVQEAKSAIDEYYFRRIGLLIATLIITFVALLMYLYVRRMEKK